MVYFTILLVNICLGVNVVIRLLLLIRYSLLGTDTVGVPLTYHYCREGEHNLMIMELLGPSLEERFNQCGRKFSLQTVLLLANQMVM